MFGDIRPVGDEASMVTRCSYVINCLPILVMDVWRLTDSSVNRLRCCDILGTGSWSLVLEGSPDDASYFAVHFNF